MMRLSAPFYYGKVIGTNVDPQCTGAVQVSVQGVTETLKDAEQPYVYPQLGMGIQQVPQIGYWLLIKFLGGDINQGLYVAMSATQNFLPPAYIQGYPNVAVGNLGEDGFFYTHNRKTHVSTIENPNGATVTWDASGAISVESDKASNEAGDRPFPVLTEATIDIFTCMPVGSGAATSGINQGSEYLSVSHVAKTTIETYRSKSADKEEAENVSDQTGDPAQETRNLVDADAKVVGTVAFEESPSFIRRSGKKYSRLIICHSSGVSFPVMAKKIASATENISVHYLVGMVEGEPEEVPEVSDITGTATLSNSGFAQFVETANDARYAEKYRVKNSKANENAIVAMFIGTGTLTDYQLGILSKMIANIKGLAGTDDIKVLDVGLFTNDSSYVDGTLE